MRIKNLLLTTLLTLLVGGSISTSIISFSNDSSYQKLEAWFHGKRLYFDFSLNTEFSKEGTYKYIHYTYLDKEYNTELTLIDNDIYYSFVHYEVLSDVDNGFELCILDSDYKSVFIKGGEDNSPLNTDYYNYICIGSYIENKDAEVIGYGVYPIDEPPVKDNNATLIAGNYKRANPGATYETQRVWLTGDINEIDEWGNKCHFMVSYIENISIHHFIDMVSVINVYDSTTYYYADIPSEVTSLRFFISSSTKEHTYLIYEDIELKNISYGSCYSYSYDSSINITTVNGANATILGLVVEAYLTYGKDDSNGASESTMRSVFNTWFKNKSATSQDLKNVKIKDYTGYAANGNSYEGLIKNSEFSVNEKWNTMCSHAGIDPNTGEYRGINIAWFQSEGFRAALIIGGVAFIVIAGVVTYLIIKKRKESNEY